ncbi:hypothetical protein JVU11DRAFT_10728 [Chiua virens]|nr:hypothetical protein JVU11DRAFT_10728 [Chiua virens]
MTMQLPQTECPYTTTSDMAPPEWATEEQTMFLQSRVNDYLSYTETKNYLPFWMDVNLAWFERWPERAACLPGVDGPLSAEQGTILRKAIEDRKNKLKRWYRWRFNSSSKNRKEKGKTSMFKQALTSKPSRVLSQSELYLQEFYKEKIKLLIKAEQESGNLHTPGEILNAGQKLSKELLEAADDDMKDRIKIMYELQKKKPTEATDKSLDPATIKWAIGELPFALADIAVLIRRHCGFAVSFFCAGPDPSKNWEITSISCHPDVTAQGNSFAHIYPDQDKAMLSAFHDYTETLFPLGECGSTSAHANGGPESSLSETGSDCAEVVEDDAKETKTEDMVRETKCFSAEGGVNESSNMSQEAFETLDLHDASLSGGNAWVTPFDVSYGMQNVLFSNMPPSLTNVDISQMGPDLGAVPGFTNAVPSHFPSVPSINNNYVTPGLGSTASLSVPSGYVDIMEGSPYVAGLGDPMFLPTPPMRLPVATWVSVGPGPDTPKSLATTSRSCSKAIQPKVSFPAPMLLTPPSISPAPSPILDTSAIAKPRPHPKVVHRKASVPGPLVPAEKDRINDATAIKKVQLPATDNPPPCNPILAEPISSSPIVMTSPSEDCPAPCAMPHIVEPKNIWTSKQVSKKSTRNEEADVIGTNQLRFVEAGTHGQQKPASCRKKRSGGDAQGKAQSPK